MLKKQETPYCKKYFLFGKCIWQHRKPIKEIAEYLLSVVSDSIKSEIDKSNAALRMLSDAIDKKFSILNESDIKNANQIDKINSNLKKYTLNTQTDNLNRAVQLLSETVDARFDVLQSDVKDYIKNIYEKVRYFKICDNKLLIDGLYNIEDWGGWINETCNIYLRFDKSIKNDVDIQIDISRFNTKSEQDLIVFINDEFYQKFVNVSGKILVQIPYQDLIKHDYKIILSFVAPNQISPFELGVGNDTRKLSYGIISIESNADVILSGFDSKSFYDFNKYTTCFMQNEWLQYISEDLNNNKLQNLYCGLSKDSVDILNLLMYRRQNEYKFSGMELYQKHLAWTNDVSKYKIVNKIGFQPEVFFFKNGLKFIDDKIIERHLSNGCIIDGGACSGDSALMFAEYDFVKKIYAFEPVKNTFADMAETLTINNCSKAEAINEGLGDKNGITEIMGEKCKVTTLDNFAKNKTISCIKLDVEGMEYKVIQGALETIKRDKPLLLICIYHTPKDFFEIKPLIESLNLGYKFKVVDTEPCNYAVGIHAMLIGYTE